MTTPEVHALKHSTLDRDIDCLKDESADNRNRIIILESSDRVLNEQMKNTICSIEDLINWIKWGLGIGVVGYVSFFAWLMQQQLK